MAGDPDDDNRPTPDPTVLTTEQLLRTENALKEQIIREIGTLQSRFQREIQCVDEVRDARFETVDLQFKLIERQRVEQRLGNESARLEQKADTQKAVDAAFSAAKDAVREQTVAFALATTKSENMMTDQIKQLGLLVDTSIAGITLNHSDLKDRVSKMENLKAGGQAAYAGLYVAAGLILAAAAFAAGFAGR